MDDVPPAFCGNLSEHLLEMGVSLKIMWPPIIHWCFTKIKWTFSSGVWGFHKIPFFWRWFLGLPPNLQGFCYPTNLRIPTQEPLGLERWPNRRFIHWWPNEFGPRQGPFVGKTSITWFKVIILDPMRMNCQVERCWKYRSVMVIHGIMKICRQPGLLCAMPFHHTCRKCGIALRNGT